MLFTTVDKVNVCRMLSPYDSIILDEFCSTPNSCGNFYQPYSLESGLASDWGLFVALGAQVIEGNGSRVRFELNGVVASFHRPHPHKEAKPYQVRDARRFLAEAGVRP